MVSLATALVGLAVGYAGVTYVHVPLGPRMTLAGYTIMRRCLPIALIVASMTTTAAVGSRLSACARRRPPAVADTNV
eukprot:3436407-Prymnesium_polylepis.1